MEILQSKWKDIILSIKEENNLTDISYRTWLEPLEIYAIDGDVLYILFTTETDQMSIDYIRRKYAIFIQVAITEQTGQEYDLKFILPKDMQQIGGSSKIAEKKQGSRLNNTNYRKSNLIQIYSFDNFFKGS